MQSLFFCNLPTFVWITVLSPTEVYKYINILWWIRNSNPFESYLERLRSFWFYKCGDVLCEFKCCKLVLNDVYALCWNLWLKSHVNHAMHLFFSKICKSQWNVSNLCCFWYTYIGDFLLFSPQSLQSL